MRAEYEKLRVLALLNHYTSLVHSDDYLSKLTSGHGRTATSVSVSAAAARRRRQSQFECTGG